MTQNDENPGVSRYSADFSTLEEFTSIPRSTAGHVGAVSIVGGELAVALEGPEAVMMFDRDLRQTSLVAIDRPIETDGIAHLAWCSVDPATGLLYTCDWNFATVLEAYDPATGEPVPEANIGLDKTVHRVQGAAFTPTGHVYLASDDRLNLGEWWRTMLGLTDQRPTYPGITRFSTTSGELTDYLRVPVSFWPPFVREIEGLGVGDMDVDGVTTHVHLSYLIKDHSWRRDSVIIRSYVVPEPGEL